MLQRLVRVGLTTALVALPCLMGVVLSAQPPAQPVDGFVPLDSLPPREQLPAAPFLITAYIFVWLLLMFYLWTIARRLSKVEQELHTLERRGSRGGTR